MSTILLDAAIRTDLGKGASRRLRRLENHVPAIVYGGEKKPQNIHLCQFKVAKLLENEAFYSSLLSLNVDGKKETVILKALQRHPYKPVILHMDFQRVSDKETLVRMVPLHFMQEQKSPGVQAGGVMHHDMTQVEVRCQAKYLPEFIEVDVSSLTLDAVLHLSDLKLPAHVQLAVEPTGDHNHAVVSIHMSKGAASEAEPAASATIVEEDESSAAE